MATELPLVFDADGDELVGILHEAPGTAGVGIVIVTGGPQYRVGSHRQFVRLARSLSREGFDVLRFDYRGMGDSDGAPRTFEGIDVDIRHAIDELQRRRPSVRGIQLLGLCDGASAALMYAPTDARVWALTLINPWARSEAGLARATVRYYYLRRLFSADFWRKVFGGGVAFTTSMRDVAAAGKAAYAKGSGPAFLARMEHAAKNFGGPVLIVLSGNDLTASEFSAWVESDRARRRTFNRSGIRWQVIAGANHTLSSLVWMDQLAAVACRAAHELHGDRKAD